MKLLHQLTLQSRYEEVEKVEGFLALLQRELHFDDELYAKLMLTVSEAATNGIVHGNKLDETKKVHLEAFSDGIQLVIKTTDEGEGFDPDEIPDPLAEENLLKASGRGVFLMEEYADKVEYSDNHSTLTLYFTLPKNN